jgi:hypothetical protein
MVKLAGQHGKKRITIERSRKKCLNIMQKNNGKKERILFCKISAKKNIKKSIKRINS